MRPDADARYPDAAGFLADLERFQEGLAVEAWREPAYHRLGRFWSRNALLLWLLTAYAAVKFGLYFWGRR